MAYSRLVVRPRQVDVTGERWVNIFRRRGVGIAVMWGWVKALGGRVLFGTATIVEVVVGGDSWVLGVFEIVRVSIPSVICVISVDEG